MKSRVLKRPEVLALGSGITLLGVLRALSDIGIRALTLPDAIGPARRSRWFRSAPPQFAGATADNLPRLLASLPQPTVVMPCSDSWVRAVASLPDHVKEHYPSSVAPLNSLETLVDKARFGATLDRLGLPHPETHFLSRGEDLRGISAETLSQSFLKPLHSQQFFAHFGVKAFRVAGAENAETTFASCTSAGFEMLLQRYVPGPPTNHYFVDGFVDRAGTTKALFARRRLRMNPPDFGNSTAMVSVPVAEVDGAPQTLRTLFADLHYRGIFSAEFKRDGRDGVLKLIEVNARPWWYVEFAARCGVNVCDLAMRDALGEPVPTITRYSIGRRCVFPYYDLDAVRSELSAGRITLTEWARSWAGAYQPVFRWSDPVPAISEIAGRIGGRIRRFTARAQG